MSHAHVWTNVTMIRRQSEWDFLLKFLILRMNESVKANVGCQEACELHELLLRNFKPLNAICPCSNVCDIDSLPSFFRICCPRSWSWGWMNLLYQMLVARSLWIAWLGPSSFTPKKPHAHVWTNVTRIRCQSGLDLLLTFLILRMLESVMSSVGCQEACEMHDQVFDHLTHKRHMPTPESV
jgi:hypothetical protein